MKSPLSSGGGNLTSNKKLISRVQCSGPQDIATLVQMCIEKLEVDQNMYISVNEVRCEDNSMIPFVHYRIGG